MPPRADSLSISALSVSQQRLMLRFDRVIAKPGQARYKRKAKAVLCIANADNNCIGEFVLHANTEEQQANALSKLLVLESKIEGDKNFVLLSFTVDTVDGLRSQRIQQWFQVVVGDKLTLSTEFISRFMVSEKVGPRLQMKYSARERVRKPKVEEIDMTKEEMEVNKQRATKRSLQKKQENEVRFASYHPVKGYRLHRNAERPPLRPQSNDHRGYLGNRQSHEKRQQFKAAIDAAEVEFLCRGKQRKFLSMLSELNASGEECRGVSPDIDCWLQQMNEARVDVAAVEVDEHNWSSEFKGGEYVEIRNAVIKPEFNGQRVRLYSKTADEKIWVVRVLGKSGGKRRCNEAMFVKLSELEQKRAVPSGASASFEDVGIDDSGQPNIELKTLKHRQFGDEYSAALTARIKLLIEKYPTVFSTDVSEPCLFEPMKIRLLPNAVLPSKARFYRNTPKMREEVKRQIQEQLEWGAIRKCVTPCVSDVLLVKRPHMPGKFRFCVSYIKLNDATVKEQLIMPDPKSQHERLAGMNIFGAFDFSSYYRQIRLHEDSQYLTGFASDEGTYCYTRVPMGITGAINRYYMKLVWNLNDVSSWSEVNMKSVLNQPA